MFLQVAGHGELRVSPTHPDRLEKPTELSEIKMYEAIWNGDALLEPLRPFVPRFYGATQEIDGRWIITIENMQSGMHQPSVMDIKVGAIRHTPSTPHEKVKKILAKEGPGSSPYENYLRVCGVHHQLMPTRSHEAADVVLPMRWTENKDFGRMHSMNDICDVLRRFCTTHSGEPPDSTLVQMFIDQLEAFAATLTDDVMSKYSFISASVLFVHNWNDALRHHSKSAHCSCATVRLVDLARSGHRDELFGDEIVHFRDGIRRLCGVLHACTSR